MAMETPTTFTRINEACDTAYQMLKSAFHDKLIECGFTKTKADELATFIVSAIEGGIILSRTSHTADPLRVVAKQLKIILPL